MNLFGFGLDNDSVPFYKQNAINYQLSSAFMNEFVGKFASIIAAKVLFTENNYDKWRAVISETRSRIIDALDSRENKNVKVYRRCPIVQITEA